MRHGLILSAILFACCTPIRGAEPQFYYKLPKDGVWCQYHVNLKIAGVETSAPWVVASVGGKVHDGDKCRWLELRQLTGDSKKTVRVIKALIPENAFGKGKNPLAEVRSVWTKEGDAEPKEITDDRELEIFNRFVMLALRGPTDNIESHKDPQSIDWQKGQLKCRVITGTSDFESEESGLKAKLKHRLLTNEKIPFRLGGSKWSIDVEIFGQEVQAAAEVTIVKTGTEARSELPNVQ